MRAVVQYFFCLFGIHVQEVAAVRHNNLSMAFEVKLQCRHCKRSRIV